MRKYKLVDLGSGQIAVGYGKSYLRDFVYHESKIEECLAQVLYENVSSLQFELDKLEKEFLNENYSQYLNNCNFQDLLA